MAKSYTTENLQMKKFTVQEKWRQRERIVAMKMQEDLLYYRKNK